jgi:hypothetical protein
MVATSTRSHATSLDPNLSAFKRSLLSGRMNTHPKGRTNYGRSTLSQGLFGKAQQLRTVPGCERRADHYLLFSLLSSVLVSTSITTVSISD